MFIMCIVANLASRVGVSNIYLRGLVQLGAVWDLGPTSSVNKFLKMSLPTTKALS